MQSSLRAYALVIVLVVLLVVVGVVVAVVDTKGVPGLNRIAYVDLDGQVLSMNPDGSDHRSISAGDGFFTWPTWSPDAKTLVFSGVEGDRGSGLSISLYSFDTASGQRKKFFVGDPGVAGLLAQGVVHYPLWSPDSKRLAFIAVTARGLTLFVDEVSAATDVEPVLDRGPLWMSWSSDSAYLLVHRGADHFLVDAARGNAVERLDAQAIEYRVPAWTPRRQTVTVLSSNGPGLDLGNADVVDGKLGKTRPIAQVTRGPAFLWAPDGAYLALADTARRLSYLGLNLFAYRDLRLIPGDARSKQIEFQDNILAYFWSPDSTKLAYVTLAEGANVLRWKLLNVADGSQTPLVDFVPSRDQLTMLQFFDQYAYSHLLWSPDSRSLVFAGELRSGAVTASAALHPGHPGSHIIVIDTEPTVSVEVIVPGNLGFWSPR